MVKNSWPILIDNLGYYASRVISYTRDFGDGPHHFKPWSSDEDDTRAGTTLLTTPPHHGRTFQLSTDSTCIVPQHGGAFSGTGLELMTCQLGSDTLTTRLPRP
ncbi:hypothetical protein TNCV_4309351 [Trichonephila clavipes]|nr:hypothetical protein TNCV_4309351 [Trichonephila clavipes]